MRLLAAVAQVSDDVLRELDQRVVGAKSETESNRVRRRHEASPPDRASSVAAAPTLIVSGGSERARTAIALKYLQLLVEERVIRPRKTLLMDGGSLSLLEDADWLGMERGSESGPEGFAWSRFAGSVLGRLREADAIAVLEVRDGNHRLRDLANAAHGASCPLVVTTEHEVVVTDDLPGINDLTVGAAQETLRRFGLDSADLRKIPFIDGECPGGLLQQLEEPENGTAWRLCAASGGRALLAPDQIEMRDASMSDSGRQVDPFLESSLPERSDPFRELLVAEPRLGELVRRCSGASGHEYWNGNRDSNDPVVQVGVNRLVKRLVGPSRDPRPRALSEVAEDVLRREPPTADHAPEGSPDAPWRPLAWRQGLWEDSFQGARYSSAPARWGDRPLGLAADDVPLHPNDITVGQVEAWLRSPEVFGQADDYVHRSQPADAPS